MSLILVRLTLLMWFQLYCTVENFCFVDILQSRGSEDDTVVVVIIIVVVI